MPRWGKEKIIHGAKFVPLIGSRTWAQISANQMIVDVVLLDDGGNRRKADIKLADLKSKHIGKPYHNWG